MTLVATVRPRWFESLLAVLICMYVFVSKGVVSLLVGDIERDELIKLQRKHPLIWRITLTERITLPH
jgi:hypothetical protein